MADMLKNIAQGLQSFTQNIPLSDIKFQEQEREFKRLQNIMQTDQDGLQAAFQDAAVMRDLLNRDPSGQSALQFGTQRLETGLSQGRNMIHTRQLLDEIISDPSKAAGSLDSFLSIPQEMQGRSESKFQKGAGGLVFDPDSGSFKVDPVAAQNAKEAREADLAHKQEIKKLEIEATKAKERTKGLAEREKADIDDGLSAAQTVPILKRADKLLDIVTTGKPQQARLWAKRFFGIESGNESELTNLLGKQILKQLKPIFGAQFTVTEGQWLKDMEADFGRSTEANRRLIRQGLDLMNERAKIGLQAAEASGDFRTLDNINGWLNFSFANQTVDQDQQTTDEFTGFKVVR